MALPSALKRLPLALIAPFLLFAAPPAAKAVVFNPETFTLDNGLQVVVVSNHRAPVVTHMIWYKVGAADELPGKSGLAHFLEHLMFKGTKDVPPGGFSAEVAHLGGNENAFTSEDYTAYFQSVAVEHLPTVMKLEADRMANLVLTDPIVLPERDVILEERRMRIDNDPNSQLNEMVQAALFLNNHYRIPTIGWENEMRGLTTEDAIAFYNRWYAPNNAILVISGDVTAAQVKPLAEKYYGVVPRKAVPARARLEEPQQWAPRRVVLKSRRVQQPSWSRRYQAPSYHHGATEHAYPLEVLSEILGGGPTSRLYRRLVVGDHVAVSVGAYYDPDAIDLSTFTIYGSPVPGGDVDTIEKAMDAELAKLVKDGVTQAELDSAKSQLQADAVKARDSLSGPAHTIGAALATGHTVADVEAWPDRIGAVTVAQVNAAARAVLDLRRSVTGELLAEPTS